MIDGGNHLPLALPVGKGEFQIFHGSVSLKLPGQPVRHPFMIFVQKLPIPQFQFPCVKLLSETAYLLCIKVGVGHLYTDMLKAVLFRVDPCVAHRLGAVDLHRRLQGIHISVNPLDLIDTDFVLPGDDSVGTAFHPDGQIFIFCIHFQRDLRLISAFHLTLYFSVEAAPFLHGFFIGGSLSAVQIPASENKLYQISDGNTDYFFLHLPYGPPPLCNAIKSVYPPYGNIRLEIQISLIILQQISQ